jgi:hypothetical protein
MNTTDGTSTKAAEAQGPQHVACEAGLSKQRLAAVFRVWRFAGADEVILHAVRGARPGSATCHRQVLRS